METAERPRSRSATRATPASAGSRPSRPGWSGPPTRSPTPAASGSSTRPTSPSWTSRVALGEAARRAPAPRPPRPRLRDDRRAAGRAAARDAGGGARLAVRALPDPGLPGLEGDGALVARTAHARRRRRGRDRALLPRAGTPARREPGAAAARARRPRCSGTSRSICSSGTAPACTRTSPARSSTPCADARRDLLRIAPRVLGAAARVDALRGRPLHARPARPRQPGARRRRARGRAACCRCSCSTTACSPCSRATLGACSQRRSRDLDRSLARARARASSCGAAIRWPRRSRAARALRRRGRVPRART